MILMQVTDKEFTIIVQALKKRGSLEDIEVLITLRTKLFYD